LQIDELQWKTFVILNSTVGDMVRLLGQSLSIVSDSVGSERTEFISLNLAPFPSAKELISRGIMTEEWIGYLVQLRAEYRRISTSVAQLQFEFSIARAILHEGFVLVVELAKASRMIGYSIALVELNGKSTGP